MMNLFEERNFIQSMGNAIMLSECLGFFLLSFGFRVGRLQVGGEVFFFQVYVVWRVDYPEWTLDFPCKFYWG